MKQLVAELRELHTNVGGAIEIIDLLVDEGSQVLLSEWASNLFKMAIEIEVRASNLSRRNPNNTEVRNAETEGSAEESGDEPETDRSGGS